MGDVQKLDASQTAPAQSDPGRDAMIDVLSRSLYPGATRDSVALVLDYCRAARLDPMQKPVHIVPMSVKVPGTNRYEYRDTIMPGIALYRVQAARTGDYAGRSEPEFGPTIETKVGGVTVRHPEWCKITVRRIVRGAVAEFPAKEFWLENVATDREGRPNQMWRKRPHGQIAKCAEAQALRAAFPELIGGTETAEEMEGKTIDVTPLHDPAHVEDLPKTEAKRRRAEQARAQLDGFAGAPSEPEPEPEPEKADGVSEEVARVEAASAAIEALVGAGKMGRAWSRLAEAVRSEAEPVVRAALLIRHADIVEWAQGYNDAAREAVVELMSLAKGEQADDDDKADPGR